MTPSLDMFTSPCSPLPKRMPFPLHIFPTFRTRRLVARGNPYLGFVPLHTSAMGLSRARRSPSSGFPCGLLLLTGKATCPKSDQFLHDISVGLRRHVKSHKQEASFVFASGHDHASSQSKFCLCLHLPNIRNWDKTPRSFTL